MHSIASITYTLFLLTPWETKSVQRESESETDWEHIYECLSENKFTFSLMLQTHAHDSGIQYVVVYLSHHH